MGSTVLPTASSPLGLTPKAHGRGVPTPFHKHSDGVDFFNQCPDDLLDGRPYTRAQEVERVLEAQRARGWNLPMGWLPAQ